MRRTQVLLVTTLLCAAPCAHAQNPQGGSIHLAWDDCYNGGAGGSVAKGFACDTDVGPPFVLVASVFPPSGLTHYTGHVASIEMHVSTQTVPDWWRIGQCRAATALTAAPATGQTSCPDLVDLPQFGGMDYVIGADGRPDRTRLRSAFAVDPASIGPIPSDLERTLVRISLSRSRTAGTDACSGCQTSVCIVFRSVRLEQEGPERSEAWITSGEAQEAYWNDPAGAARCYTSTHARTWGQIKSLYR